MIVRIDPPLPVKTIKGDGMAHFLIDYGVDYDLLFVVFVDLTGECWTFKNTEIRAVKNITMGRTYENQSLKK